MKILNVILFLILLLPVSSGVIVQNEIGETCEKNSMPVILYSSTSIFESKNQINSEIISIFEDGTCLYKQSIDNSGNKNEPKEKRGIVINNFGPYPLSEEIRASLQYFFSESCQWILPGKACVKNKSGIWLGELSLRYAEISSNCYLSSTDKTIPELSESGYLFLELLDRIKEWMVSKG